MRRIVSIIAGAGALVIGMSLSAWAHGRSTASSSSWSAFVDEDGDGIHDSAARQHCMQGRTGKRGAGLDLRGIALTPEQQTQISQLKSDHQKTVVSLQATLQTRQIELRGLMRAAQPDQNAINAKIDEINAARSELQKEMTSFQSSVLNALTPEQRAALDVRNLGRKGIALTPDQQTQISQLKSDHQKATVSLQATLQTRQIELRGLMRAAQPDQNAINAKIDEINAARSELQKEMTSFRLSVRALLTPEQRAALDAERLADGRMGHGHRHKGHGFRDKDRGHRDKDDECRDEDDDDRGRGKKHHKRGEGHGHRR